MDDEARSAAAAMWDGADYDRLAVRFAPAASAVAELVVTRGAPAGPALDLAAGTGSLSVALARHGRRVHALDIAPGLVAQGRERTTTLGLDVTWRVAAMDDLADREAYAVVGSSFGIIFSPEPVATLRRVRDALVPGGLVALAVWDPAGYVSRMSAAMGEVLPEPGRTAATAWVPWGDEDVLVDRLTAAGLSGVAVETRTLPWRFGSVDAAVDLLFEASPGHVAASRFSGAEPALRAAVRDHLLAHAGLTDPAPAVDVEASYVLATARRPG